MLRGDSAGTPRGLLRIDEDRRRLAAAHLLAYPEVNGLPEIWSEDFQHGRIYGTVRIVDPFDVIGQVEQVNDPRAERPYRW